MGLEKFILTFFDFVGGINFNIFSFVLILLFIIFWLVIVGWVWIDSSERTSRKGLRFAYMLLAILLNIPGLIIYLIIRPSETIEEIYWADLERRYLKFETSELGDCPKCGHQLYPGYVFCTNCGFELKKRCPKCNVLINKDHKFCEYCGEQIRDRAMEQEKYPNMAVMEQQIIATKEHATETVESKRTRYKTGDSFVVKLGDALVGAFLGIRGRVEKKEEKVQVEEKVENIDTDKQKKKNKKKKKKK
ncbi:zinc-ribbon domain-containing protein [Candidatus Dojkabacteria bacterium]|nr:zinc-ribbon domain-containing protein [Candidatus Dojkabacteria bacterium]